ncbi:MAG: NAD(P)-dependent oxidoreductase [Anaerolineales bacterium]|nr:NAD(P)-dependent oxidoreductase [Anaerolineales bacterium]
MKVLITGGGGFIGSHLIESQLGQGNFVRTIDLQFERLLDIKNHQNLELIEGDLTHQDQIDLITKGIDVVYHLASAHLDVRLSKEHYQRVNVSASLNLVESAHIHGVKRFVHCSSVGVIGDVIHPPADETTECRPTNIYEQTKLEGERAVLDYGQKKGFCVVVARPAWVYGPRCPRTEKLLRTIARGRFVIFGSGGNLRHPVYIADAVRGLELCAQKEEICGQIYIVAGGTPVTINELVKIISEEVGRKTSFIQLPVNAGLLISMLMEKAFLPFGRQPPFSRRSMDFFLKNNAYHIGKSKLELDYYPQVDLVTGIKKTIEWNKRRTFANP